MRSAKRRAAAAMSSPIARKVAWQNVTPWVDELLRFIARSNALAEMRMRPTPRNGESGESSG